MKKFHFPKLDLEKALKRGETLRGKIAGAVVKLDIFRAPRRVLSEVEAKWKVEAIFFLSVLTFLIGGLVVWEIFSAMKAEEGVLPPVPRQVEIAPKIEVPVKPKAEFVLPKRPTVKVAIILDDAGGQYVDYAAIFSIDASLTISVLPNMASSQGTVVRVRAAGKEAMLHLPMEPINGSFMRYDGTMVLTSMADETIKEVVAKALSTVRGVVGVNNHMGSRSTEDKRVMDDILGVINDRGLFFVDSRTARDSVAYDRAKAIGIRAGKSVIFLDVYPSQEAIEKRIGELVELAKKNGGAIGIGHATRGNTIRAIKRMVPKYRERGVEFVFASELAR